MKRWMIGYKIYFQDMVGWYDCIVHADTEIEARHKFNSEEIIYFIAEI